MLSLASASTLILGSLVALAADGGAGAPEKEAVFETAPLASSDVVTALRSIADTKRLEILDGDTVRVWGGAEEIALAAKVVALVVEPPETEAEPELDEVGDGSVIARVILERTDTRSALTELRKLGLGHIAIVEKRKALLFRDAPEQVEKALERIAALEAAAP